MLSGPSRPAGAPSGLPPYYTQRLHVVRPPTPDSGRQDPLRAEAEAQAERLFRDFKLGLLALVVLALLLLAYFWDGEQAALRGGEQPSDVLAFTLSGVRRAEFMPTIVEPEPAKAPPAERSRGPAQAVPPRAWTYVVRPGDTLGGIAERVYGDATRWRAILEANSGVLRRPADLRPGMRLLLPAAGGRGPPVSPPLARAGPLGAR